VVIAPNGASADVPPLMVGCDASPNDTALVKAADPVSVIGTEPEPFSSVRTACPTTSCGVTNVPPALYIVTAPDDDDDDATAAHAVPLNHKTDEVVVE
jgi:hypothetical protein